MPRETIFGQQEIPVRPVDRPFREWFFDGLADQIWASSSLDDDYAEQCRNNLLDFTLHTFPDYKADSFHMHVCSNITDLVIGQTETERNCLMLFAPPQTGKSEIVSTRLPSFWLAHHPDMPVGLVSYGGKLAFRNSVYARNVFESPQYGQLFPELQPDRQNWRIQDWYLQDHKGYVFATGVGGSITGYGFGLIIIDDPIENWAAAQSDIKRESVWQWYQGTLKTRIWEHGSIILMMTRWHEDDLAARILDSEGRVEEGGKWKVLSYPALCETNDPKEDILGRNYGEALAPSRYSAGYLREVRDSSIPFVWNAEYQQKPTAPEGEFFKIGRIEIVEALPANVGRAELIDEGAGFYAPVGMKKGVRFWDLAATEAKQLKDDPDSTSGSLLAEESDLFYWCDCINERLGPYECEDLIALTSKVDGKKVKVRIETEPGASGKALNAYYVRKLKGFDIDGWPSGGSKLVKNAPFASQVNAGNVRMLKGAWNRRALMQLASFPHGKHDDDADSISGAFNVVTSDEDEFKNIEFKHI